MLLDNITTHRHTHNQHTQKEKHMGVKIEKKRLWRCNISYLKMWSNLRFCIGNSVELILSMLTFWFFAWFKLLLLQLWLRTSCNQHTANLRQDVASPQNSPLNHKSSSAPHDKSDSHTLRLRIRRGDEIVWWKTPFISTRTKIISLAVIMVMILHFLLIHCKQNSYRNSGQLNVFIILT